MQNFPAGFRPLAPVEDTGSKTVTVAAGAFSRQEVCRIQAKNARRFFLAFLGNNVDAPMAGLITFRVLVDGAVLYPYQDTLGQWAPPEQPFQELTPYIELPQNALVVIEADGTAGNPGGNITGRLRGYYGQIEPPSF